ncbi:MULTISPECIES: hypothetical protein [Legionella]|uniref:Uncharacterized protein n=1 Tax=Legionella drozanskii LLAP-1 TaxID=1212489 RepID=A0A0W0SQK7_9GAMM|nr:MULTISPECIES: hypothetical protein [Legionella]KTC85537.1 hypothetical protein Ldro_1862 [Legionella drozanskii LLAP-1]
MENENANRRKLATGKKAHPSLHSDSEKYGIKPDRTDNKKTNVKKKAHPNFHSDAEKKN